MRRRRPPGTTPIRAILSVNRQFLAAFFLGFIAWLSWPTSAEWWPFAILSVITAAAAVGYTIGAVVLMVRIHARDRQIAAMLAKGRVAHPAEMIDRDALRRAGMSDD